MKKAISILIILLICFSVFMISVSADSSCEKLVGNEQQVISSNVQSSVSWKNGNI